MSSEIEIRNAAASRGDRLTISVIGAGMIGQTMARLIGSLGHDVRLANSRGRKSVAYVASAWGAVPVDVSEAGAGADLIILAIPFSARDEVLKAIDPAPGTIVIDPTNYWEMRDGAECKPEEGQVNTLALAERWPNVKVVKALNILFFEKLKELARPELPDEQRAAMPICSDDEDAKKIVAHILRELGFAPIDCGGLATSNCLDDGSNIFSRSLNLDAAPTIAQALDDLRGNGINGVIIH